MIYTVIGGQGFIGSTIVKLLEAKGHTVWVPEKEDKALYERELGIVIYAAGHGDCKNNPLKVFNSNLGILVNIITKASFDKFIYISSTRVYMNQLESIENSDVKICADDERALFNLTKLTAENILLQTIKNSIVVRPSNVYGLALDSPLFLPSIVRNAITTGKVDMYVSKEYAKDYVSVDDVAKAIYQLSKAENLADRIFNIASGFNVTASQIGKVLKEETGCEIFWHEGAVDEVFPATSTNRISECYKFSPKNVLIDLKKMIRDYKASMQ
jgi:nucleoside-diphosphate-sugar epimerase